MKSEQESQTRRRDAVVPLVLPVDGVLDEDRVRQVAQRVAARSRRGALPILAHFQRLVRLDRERHTALVESAVPLAATCASDIAGRPHAPLRSDGLEMSFGENPALIGGMRIKVGSDVYDGSVPRRLEALGIEIVK